MGPGIGFGAIVIGPFLPLPLPQSLFLHTLTVSGNTLEQDGRLDAETQCYRIYINRALDRIGNLGDGICNIVNKFRFLERVGAGVGKQQVGLEFYEITLAGRYIVLHLLQRVLTGERIGILALGQQHHLNVQALGQEEIDPPQSCMYAGAVAVVHNGGVLRKLVDQAYLLHGKRCAAGGHHVGYSELMQGDHIHVALHQDAFAAAGNFPLGEPDAQQVAALDVYFGLRRIDVLGRIVGVKRASAESQHTAAYRMDGEHHPLAEFVGYAAVFVLHGQPCGQKIFHFVARSSGGIHQRGLARRSPSQPETGDGSIFEASLAEIGKADGTSLRSLQLRGIELLGEFRHQKEALAALPLGNLIRALFLLNYFDMVLVGQPAEGLHIRAVLMLHHEAHCRARLAAAEALVDAFRWGNVERWGLFVVEGTAGHIVGPAALKRHEVPHHIFNPGCVEDKRYCILRNHDAISHKNFMRTRRISISS